MSIDPATVAVLRQHREKQAKEREFIGPSRRDSDLVFRLEMGGPQSVDQPGALLRATVGALDTPEAPLPAIRLHDLRHIHATLLLKAGVPVHVVAARLGHRDAAMTLRVYAHVLSNQDASAASTFGALMASANAPVSTERQHGPAIRSPSK